MLTREEERRVISRAGMSLANLFDVTIYWLPAKRRIAARAYLFANLAHELVPMLICFGEIWRERG